MFKKYCIQFLTLLFIVSFLLLIGCATTYQSDMDDTPVGDVADIDQLLGLADEKTSEEETIDEDEVMKLLGVVEDKSDLAAAGDGTERDTSKTGSDLAAGDDQYDGSLSGSEQSSTTLAYAETKDTIGTSEPVSFTWKTTSYSNRYKEALDSYQSHQYREAIQKFEALLTMDRTHTLSDNCQYWIGESYYGIGSYQQAIVAFQKVFSFAKSNKNDAAQLKLGLCYMRLDDKSKAKVEFQKLIDEHPTSEYNSIAKRFIEKME